LNRNTKEKYQLLYKNVRRYARRNAYANFITIPADRDVGEWVYFKVGALDGTPIATRDIQYCKLLPSVLTILWDKKESAEH